MESSVEWHNENRGVFMINQYYKQQRNYDDKIKRLGAKLVQLDENLEVEDLRNIDDDDNEVYDNQED